MLSPLAALLDARVEAHVAPPGESFPAVKDSLPQSVLFHKHNCRPGCSCRSCRQARGQLARAGAVPYNCGSTMEAALARLVGIPAVRAFAGLAE
jgi:hypothetical protein